MGQEKGKSCKRVGWGGVGWGSGANETAVPHLLQSPVLCRALHSHQGKQSLCKQGIGGTVTLGIGRRSSTRLTLLFLGQCSALTEWSILVQPREPVATPAITATFSGARMPGILTHMCYCLPSPHSHPRLKVGSHTCASAFPVPTAIPI